ncbi:putative dolichyl pyrophosphate Man9GlcNAc2 alpha-1,3-glucosyltransferase [Silene latifolia]|uniref:putative dolichyl pyrophosphate Man9GlcNAc2 alpha-1,3-glucosyltransferase n=1 Tax=Silene latifolia TaxID=37657 RepID=UPI003D786D04
MENKTEIKDIRDQQEDSPWWWIANKGLGVSFICVSLFAVLVRLAVSLHPYSGAGTPPKFGDFEAQRHWMEITVNLPVKDWYRNSTINDLSYWGLDYPPLTAYQSYVHGLILKFFLPESVALFTSRGHESYLGKLLMRWTVLSSDILVFFPAVFCFILAYRVARPRKHQSDIVWLSTMILINPSLIIIDHGHFQFNCISLGLTMGAIAAIISSRDLVACALFTLALSHKQMSAYFAPAFFSHLLGRCLRRHNPFLEVSKLGFVVIGTIAVVWWPYLHSKEAFFEVLARLAPFERGIYEDYVANFWCTTSVLIKWKKLFATQSLKLISLVATISACLPSMIQQIKYPCNKGFLYGLLNSSFAFYLFSYQVHEKSILLPLLPASLMALEEPMVFRWLTKFALFSMFPLVCRDQLVLAYFSLFILFDLTFYAPPRRRSSKKFKTSPRRTLLMFLLLLCILVIHIVYLTLRPPERYPFLFEAILMMVCFSQFVLLALYTNSRQWMLSKRYASMENDKKVL